MTVEKTEAFNEKRIVHAYVSNQQITKTSSNEVSNICKSRQK